MTDTPPTAGKDPISTPATRQALHAFVRGRVQGVGYRDFVQRQALRLGLSGWVRNLPDGRAVEVQAAGTRAALDELLGRLREGPRFAHVSEVEVDWSAPIGQFNGFEVRY